MADAGMTQWAGRSVDHWRTLWRLPLLQIHPAVDSTNDLALALARDGAPHGATIMAESQLRGRGRRGRDWLAPVGSSLLLSMVLRPPAPGTERLLPLRLGLAAARAIERDVPLRVGLKWPNDLVVDRLKVGGILCEARSEPGHPIFVVAGIGLNVAQTQDDWPAPLRDQAASLEQVAGAPLDRARLAGRVIAEWIAAASLDPARLTRPELEEFHQRDVLRRHPITIDGRPAGIAQGIDPDGALRAGDPRAPHRVMAGTVRRCDLGSA
jgi:BirA family transcriptional regulator, biotin operon repressor / biotin---[acetyl-CoA-carboxylase] ligase